MLASNIERCVQAAHAFLLGIQNTTTDLIDNDMLEFIKPRFKSKTNATVNASMQSPLPVGWNTFSVITCPPELDTLFNLNDKDACPNKNMKVSENEKELVNSKLNHEKEFKEVIDVYGIGLQNYKYHIDRCFDFFMLVQSDYYLVKNPIISPDGPYAGTYNRLKACYEAEIFSLFGSDDDLTMAGSPLLLNITENTDNYIKAYTQQISTRSQHYAKKLIVYSNREKSFVPVLFILGLLTRKCVYDRYLGLTDGQACVEFPHFGKMLNIELIVDDAGKPDFKSQHLFFVRIMYDDEFQDVGGLSDDESRIPYEKFKEYVGNNTFADWDVRCGLSENKDKPVSQIGSWVMFMGISNLALFAVVLAAFCSIWKGKRRRASSSEEPIVNHEVNTD